jgi:hypothetical protein
MLVLFVMDVKLKVSQEFDTNVSDVMTMIYADRAIIWINMTSITFFKDLKLPMQLGKMELV